MDAQEAIWLATIHWRERQVAEADEWVIAPEIEEREMGWVVTFQHSGHFKPGDGPPPRSLYVFRDGYVEAVSKHGPKFHESRRRRSEGTP